VPGAELIDPLADEGDLGVDVAKAEHPGVVKEERPGFLPRSPRAPAHQVAAKARLQIDEARRAGGRRDADAGLAPRLLLEPLDAGRIQTLLLSVLLLGSLSRAQAGKKEDESEPLYDGSHFSHDENLRLKKELRPFETYWRSL
jgi:hypothetical protein